jgi:hypothetical protein
MNWRATTGAILAGAFMFLLGCDEIPVQSVPVPRADDPSAYRPQPMPKPLPPPGDQGLSPQPMMQPQPGTGPTTMGGGSPAH